MPQDHDICFTWNGTTSGVCVPNGDWISDDRTGEPHTCKARATPALGR